MLSCLDQPEAKYKIHNFLSSANGLDLDSIALSIKTGVDLNSFLNPLSLTTVIIYQFMTSK